LPTSSKTVGQGKDGLIGCIKHYHYKKYLLGLELLVKFNWNRYWNIIRPDESTAATDSLYVEIIKSVSCLWSLGSAWNKNWPLNRKKIERRKR
jgi:hypothetical protein